MKSSTQRRKYTYSAYGLEIRSDISLPELVPSDSGKDVDISFRKITDTFLDIHLKNASTFNRPGCTVRVSSTAAFYSWDGIGTGLVCNGSTVIVSPQTGINNDDMAPFITGALLGNLLDQRGMFVLHGSAIVHQGKAIAFLGEKGAGKSTFVLHLQKQGYKLLTDDLVPVTIQGKEVSTVPGFPRIRLWGDSAESAGLDPESLPKINKYVDKRSYKCFESLALEPVKLSRIYILNKAPDISIDKLPAQAAFIEIVRNTYLNRYLHATGKNVNHFAKCRAIVETVPIFRLNRPHDFRLLPDVTSAVIEHLV